MEKSKIIIEQNYREISFFNITATILKQFHVKIIEKLL